MADLLRHGLLKASFIPNREQRELRELVRYRRTVIEQRAHVVQRIQKLLEGANIKLGDMTSDVMGVSGRAMLTALATADQDARTLAGMAKTALRWKIPELEKALTGSFGPHQRFMLRSQFQLLEALEAQTASLDDEVAQRMRPLQAALDHLDEIPGIGVRAAQQIIAEVGTDMTRFPTSAHFASWARICPGNNESAGKRRNSSIGGGNRWLRNALLEAAWTVSHSRRQTFFTARHRRIAARRGNKRAAPLQRSLPVGRHLSHAARWHRLPGSQPNALREAQSRGSHPPQSQTPRAARLPCHSRGGHSFTGG